jgi:hypothetical protein
MNLINLTPHVITFITEKGEMQIQPSGIIARVTVTREKIGEIEINDIIIPVYKNEFGRVENLPDPQPDTLYIVSSLVAQAIPDRKDVLIPDDSVRDNEGRIIGAKALAHV